MKKIFLFISLLFSLSATHAQNARTLFAQVPDSVLPLLTPVNRADFIDYLDSKMKAVVKNRFGNSSEMTNLSSDYIRIQVTARSTWEMKVLPVNDSTKVICTVSTACAPVCDSSIRFYSADWKALAPSTFLTLPQMDDFFLLPDSAQLYAYTNFRLKADMLLYKASFSPEGQALTFTFTTPEYMEGDLTKEQKAFLTPPLVYVWEGGAFRRK